MTWLRTLALCGLTLWGQFASAADLKAWGYVAWWLPQGWRSVPLEQFERLLVFDFPVNAEGRLTQRRGWPADWLELRLAAAQHQVPLELTLSVLDEPTFLRLFASKAAVQRLLQESMALAQDSAVAGLHLDIEVYGKVPAPVLQAFREFVTRLSAALQAMPQARSLSVFVPVGGEAQIYDAPTLARVDAAVMQGYDAHWAESPVAGPIAPLDGPSAATWRKAGNLGLSLGLARDKLLMSFPLYGYEWPVLDPAPHGKTRGKAISTTYAAQPLGVLPDMEVSVQARVKAYGAKQDPLSASAYYQFSDAQGQRFEGWFEDVQSLRRKTRYLQAQRLGGVAFFPLGYDNGLLVNQYFQLLGRREGRSGVAR